MEKRFVYADNAATTPVTPAVLEAMTPWLMENYGNPSSIYSIGRAARTAVEKARRQVAAALNAEPGEIYFTSCGTEADNWALKGSMRRWTAKGKKHLITAAFEHHAILHSAKALEKEGFEVTYLPVTPEGLVDPAELEKAIREDTALVSIMLANNEIGTVQPIAELAAIAHAHGAWFHTDAVQAVGHIPVDVKALGVDMLSLSGHKFHAPKGVGALYVKKGILPNIFMDGGAQEKGRRAGTENLASIVGLGEAITVATASLEENMARITAMRDRLIDSLLQLPRTRLNGSREHRLPGNLNISFEGIEGESLLLRLDMAGICASSGSACTSGSLDPSHVLMAIGLKHEVAHGSLRLSLSELTTEADIDYIIAQVPPIVEGLSAMSPVWEKIKDL